MNIFKKIGEAVTGGLGDLADIADKFITTKQEKEEFKAKVRQKEQEMSRKISEMYLNDVANARQMQVEALRQTDKFSKRFVYFFAGFWSLIGAGFIVIILFVEIPENNLRFADTVLGFLLGTIIATIIQFFFGSSKGSADKTDMLSSTQLHKNQAG